MSREIFDKLRKDCPRRSGAYCGRTHPNWIGCTHAECPIFYWIEAISKHTLNIGYEVKDFMGDLK